MRSLVGDSHGRAVAPVMGTVQRPTTCRIARIHLLGPMRATSYLGDDFLPRGKKARALLACLCLAAGAEVPRIKLARMLWEEAGDRAARASLSQALRDVRAAIGPLAPELIASDRATLRLNAEACWIDALALLESSSPDLALLCSGKLLEGLDGVSASFDAWLAREREFFGRKTSDLACQQTAPARSDHNFAMLSRAEIYARGPLPGRNRLRVAVLPFEPTGQGRGTERWESLAFSVSHDIVAALARFRWFDVVTPISSNSSLQVNIASADLFHRKDLDYVVDGRVSRHGQSIAIDVRLLDLTRRAQPVWSERFELQTSELHRLNEIVTGRVVGSIDPLILFIEGQPNRREHYGATGLLLMALPLLHSMEQEKLERARELIDQAMVVDPGNSMARAWAALWHIAHIVQGCAHDGDESLSHAETLSLEAIEIDPDNAEALGIYAHICAWRKNFDAAVRHFDRSLRLNPNLAFIWTLSAATCCYIGEPTLALQRLKRSRDLAPLHPYWDFLGGIYVIAYTFKGDYERAVLVGRDIIAGNPYSRLAYRHVIAALGHLRRPDEAKPYIEKVLSAEPHFTVEHFAQTYPIKRPQDRRRYMRGLLLAGVPAR